MPANFSPLMRGFIIGLSIAAPVGPIGVLCVRRTLADGWIFGLLSGLGAATADMFYGGIAAFGLAFVMDLLLGASLWLRLIGGIFLVYLGVHTFLSRPKPMEVAARRAGLLGAYVSTLLLTLTNPATILSFLGIFAGVMPAGGPAAAGVMVAGVFTGSGTWWLFLSSVVGALRTRLNSDSMMWINRISGLAIAALGAITLVGFIQAWRLH